MNKNRVVFVILALALAVMACSLQRTESGEPDENPVTSAERITQNREVTPFTSIQINGGGEVRLIQGSECGLTVEATQEVLDHLTTRVVNGRLEVGYKSDIFLKLTSTRVIFTITFVDLTGLEINGGGYVTGERLDLETLKVQVSGGAGFNLKDLTAEALEVTLDGGGSFTATGRAPKQAVTVNGAANYNTEDLESDDVSVVVNGAGSVRVWAKKTLDLKLTGAYAVAYYGSPAITQDVTGLGDIDALGEK